jgi:Na+/H+ antiporter NhaC
MRWPQLPIIPLLSCLILGYIGAAYFDFSPRNFFICLALAMLCFSIGILWSSIKKWQQSCEELAIPCHNIATAGSFRLIP